MPYYRMKVKMEHNRFIYPVPDIHKIEGPKYRQDRKEMVGFYPDTLEETEELTEIGLHEYEITEPGYDVE